MDIDSQRVGLIIMIAGLLVAAVGAAFYVLGGRLPLGGLPGDISGGGGNVRWSIPVGTSILISIVLSVVLTLVLNLVMRR